MAAASGSLRKHLNEIWEMHRSTAGYNSEANSTSAISFEIFLKVTTDLRRVVGGEKVVFPKYGIKMQTFFDQSTFVP